MVAKLTDRTTAKNRKITVRLSTEDYLAIRAEAYSQGEDMGPMLEQWLRRRIDTAKAKRAQTAAASSPITSTAAAGEAA